MSGRYRVMPEMSKLKSFSEAENSLCFCFNLDTPCIKLYENESFTFVFVLNTKQKKEAIKILVKTITYMFSDAKTETFEGYYNWAKEHSDLKSLQLTEYVWKNKEKIEQVDYIRNPLVLKFAELETSAVIQVYNDAHKGYFQEGILHQDQYEKNV